MDVPGGDVCRRHLILPGTPAAHPHYCPLYELPSLRDGVNGEVRRAIAAAAAQALANTRFESGQVFRSIDISRRFGQSKSMNRYASLTEQMLGPASCWQVR